MSDPTGPKPKRKVKLQRKAKQQDDLTPEQARELMSTKLSLSGYGPEPPKPDLPGRRGADIVIEAPTEHIPAPEGELEHFVRRMVFLRKQ